MGFLAHRFPKSEAAVVFRHGSLGDFPVATVVIGKSNTGIPPRAFLVRQLAKPMASLVAIEFEDGIDGLLFLPDNLPVVAIRPSLDRELAAMLLVKHRHNRPVRPCLDVGLKKRVLIPNQ